MHASWLKRKLRDGHASVRDFLAVAHQLPMPFSAWRRRTALGGSATAGMTLQQYRYR